MESSLTGRKEKKGLSRLWKKAKLALGLKSKTNDKQSTTVTERPGLDSEPLQTTDSMPSTHPEEQVLSAPAPATIAPPATAVTTTATTETQPSASSRPQTTEQSEISSRPEALQPLAREQDGPLPEPSVPYSERDRIASRRQRNQNMFKRCEVDYEEHPSHDVNPRSQVERVYRPPRIRVRWTCHECKTTFGHDKVCVECAHQRCRDCARYPPKKKKTRAAKIAAFANILNDPSNEDVQEGACHECQTTFETGTQECSNCHHRICDRCLQETLSSAEQVESSAVPNYKGGKHPLADTRLRQRT